MTADTARLASLLVDEIEEAGAITTGELAARVPGKEVVVEVPCDSVCRGKTRWSQTEISLSVREYGSCAAPRTCLIAAGIALTCAMWWSYTTNWVVIYQSAMSRKVRRS